MFSALKLTPAVLDVANCWRVKGQLVLCMKLYSMPLQYIQHTGVELNQNDQSLCSGSGKSLPDSKYLIRSCSKGAAYSHTSSSFHLQPFSEKTEIPTESRSRFEEGADVQELLPVGCTRMTCARVSD